MRNDNLLTKEIIHRIMGNLGLLRFPDLGKVGLSIPELKINRTLPIQYEDGIIENRSLWSGEMSLHNSKIRSMFADLSDGDVCEYALSMRVDQNPIYGMKIIFDTEDYGKFVTLEGSKWLPASIALQARALVGVEMMTTFGCAWKACNDFEDLLKAIVSISDM